MNSFAAAPSDSELVMPKVGVVVPTRNRWLKTQRFLSAIADQTYPHLQVIIVDAHSSDGTPERVRQHFPHVTVIEVSDQCYWAGSTNAGVRHALETNCDYVFTVNDDAVFATDHLEQLVRLAQTHHCLILGNRINYLAERDRIWSLGTYSNWGSAAFLTLAYCDVREADVPAEIWAQPVREVEALPGNGVLIHRSVFTRIGLYNDWLLPHYHADSELMMRANRAGIQSYVASHVVLYNDFSVEQKRLDLKSLRGLSYALLHKKSHLFLPPLLYTFVRYCPPKQWVKTIGSLGRRALSLR
ncbi:MAG: glycosyltransferase family 2 protein [Thainema sp.]